MKFENILENLSKSLNYLKNMIDHTDLLEYLIESINSESKKRSEIFKNSLKEEILNILFKSGENLSLENFGENSIFYFREKIYPIYLYFKSHEKNNNSEKLFYFELNKFQENFESFIIELYSAINLCMEFWLVWIIYSEISPLNFKNFIPKKNIINKNKIDFYHKFISGMKFPWGINITQLKKIIETEKKNENIILTKLMHMNLKEILEFMTNLIDEEFKKKRFELIFIKYQKKVYKISLIFSNNKKKLLKFKKHLPNHMNNFIFYLIFNKHFGLTTISRKNSIFLKNFFLIYQKCLDIDYNNLINKNELNIFFFLTSDIYNFFSFLSEKNEEFFFLNDIVFLVNVRFEYNKCEGNMVYKVMANIGKYWIKLLVNNFFCKDVEILKVKTINQIIKKNKY